MPVLVLALLAPAAAGADGGFLAAPTDQLTVPGRSPGPRSRPRATSTRAPPSTRSASARACDVWDVRRASGSPGATRCSRRAARAGGVRYALTTFADALGGRQRRVRPRRGGQRLARAARCRALGHGNEVVGRAPPGQRPLHVPLPAPLDAVVPGLYVQPGEAFGPAPPRIGGGAATRDGRVLYAYAGVPAAVAAGPRRAARPSTRCGRAPTSAAAWRRARARRSTSGSRSPRGR